jgi:tetratricopeptide (TPR) repeat protein
VIATTWALVAIILSLAGCTPPSQSVPESQKPVDRATLRPVSLPDLSRMDTPVQQQMREAFDSLMSVKANPVTPPADLARAYGELGNLLYAAEYADAAEPCYLNAQAIAPQDVRWPYYLGHLYKTRGEPARAVESFERASNLRGNDVATLVWLGDLYVALGRPAAADPLFARALSLQPQTVAALVGQGRVALAQHEYGRAVDAFERALALDRRGSSIHYPLALAYRGLGDTAKAEAQLQQRGDVEIGPPDPLMQELTGLLHSAVAYENRGVRALTGGDSTTAVSSFRKALELSPDSAALHHRLGTALSLGGDTQGAVDHFREAVRRSPGYAPAHYSLGVLLASSRKYAEAVDEFSLAVKFDPLSTPARLQLAEGLRRIGRPDTAVPQYVEVLKIEPQSGEAQFGYAMALVQMRRYDEARTRLTEGAKLHPERPEFAQALERLRSQP